jgi:hypothetical protein
MERAESHTWTVTDSVDPTFASSQANKDHEPHNTPQQDALPDVVDPLAKNKALQLKRDMCTKSGADSWLKFCTLGNAYHTIYAHNRKKNVTQASCIATMERYAALCKDVNVAKSSDEYKQAQQESAFAVQHMLAEKFFFGFRLAVEKFQLLPETEEERQYVSVFVTPDFGDVPFVESSGTDSSQDSASSLKAQHGTAAASESALRNDDEAL